jgi:hypothetical protein
LFPAQTGVLFCTVLPVRPPIQWHQRSFPGVNRPRRDVDTPSPSLRMSGAIFYIVCTVHFLLYKYSYQLMHLVGNCIYRVELYLYSPPLPPALCLQYFDRKNFAFVFSEIIRKRPLFLEWEWSKSTNYAVDVLFLFTCHGFCTLCLSLLKINSEKYL